MLRKFADQIVRRSWSGASVQRNRLKAYIQSEVRSGFVMYSSTFGPVVLSLMFKDTDQTDG